MHKSVLIGTLVSPTGKRHPVEAWENYGVVCPSMVTSNGDARVVARCVVEYVRHLGWTWEGPEIKGLDDMNVFRLQLIEAFDDAFPKE